MAGFWGKRKRESAEVEAQDAELSRKAGAALVSGAAGSLAVAESVSAAGVPVMAGRLRTS